MQSDHEPSYSNFNSEVSNNQRMGAKNKLTGTLQGEQYTKAGWHKDCEPQMATNDQWVMSESLHGGLTLTLNQRALIQCGAQLSCCCC